MRRACVALLLVAGLGLSVVLSSTELGCTLTDRLEERGPVDYRQAVYEGGWEMFLQRPLTGWGFNRMPAELPLHVSGYAEKTLYPHNTYLELLVEQGIVGLALYFWLMWELWRVGRGDDSAPPRSTDFSISISIACGRFCWECIGSTPTMVVMNYQFVNGLLFALAGMLAAQRRRAEALSC